MKMMGQAQQAFLEAAVAQRHADLVKAGRRTNRVLQPGRVSRVQRLIDTLSGKNRDPRRGAIRYENDGPLTRPVAAPHHATSH